MSPPAPSPSPSARVSFGSAFEGLLRAYDDLIAPRALARLAEAGLDVSRPLLAGYPLEVWYRTVRILAEEQHPKLAYGDAVHQVGRAFMRGYFETTLGRTILTVLRLLGPVRSLRRMSRNFRSGNNFSETTLHEDGPGDVRLHVNDCLADVPDFMQGLLVEAMHLVADRTAIVDVLEVTAQGDTVFRVRWQV